MSALSKSGASIAKVFKESFKDRRAGRGLIKRETDCRASEQCKLPLPRSEAVTLSLAARPGLQVRVTEQPPSALEVDRTAVPITDILYTRCSIC